MVETLEFFKKQGKSSSEFEGEVSRTLKAVSRVEELGEALSKVFITDAYEFAQQYKGALVRAVVLSVHYRSMTAVQSVYDKLVAELEKRFSRPVVVLYTRTILPKYYKEKGQQKRPRSRTLTAVHEAYLQDILYPNIYIGKRIRMRVNGSRLIKILLDPKDREATEQKLDVWAAVYRKIANKDVVFEYPVSREFPV
jgi:small subunit ribosomal protein S7e